MPQSDDFRTSGSGSKAGTICTETSLYKTFDGQVEYIQHVAAGDPFPKNLSGAGQGNATWYKLTLANDGARKTFKAVKADITALDDTSVDSM